MWEIVIKGALILAKPSFQLSGTMNQDFSNLDAQMVGGHIGSFNTVTYSEHHIHRAGGRRRDDPIDVLLSQINAVITRPRTCHLDHTLKESARRTALAIPHLTEIEAMVSRSPPATFIKSSGRGNDPEATIAEILQIQSMVRNLPEHDADEGVPLWQTLARVFGSLSSRFADIGWLVGALRMSCREVQIRCALANIQPQPNPAELSGFLSDFPQHVKFAIALARLLHHRSLYSANLFRFNDARKASKEAIQIQSGLRLHDAANTEFKSTLLWMQKHLSSFQYQDAAYNVVVSRSVGNMLAFPADVTRFDIARGSLRQGIEIFSMGSAIVALVVAGPVFAGPVLGMGLGVGQLLSSINRRS